MQSLQAQAQAIADRYTPPDVGRPSDIGDPEILKQFLEAIADGNYMETACHLVGLSKVTVHNWTKRGEAGEAPFDRFVNAVKAAEARAEAKMLANVRRASELPQFWAAGMTVLERRHPERWGKRQDDTNQPRVVVNIGVGQGDVKVGIALSPLVSEDLHSLSHCNNSELRPISNLMLTAPDGAQPAEFTQIPAVESAGGPYPVGREPARPAVGLVEQRGGTRRVSARGGRLKKTRRGSASLAARGAGDASGG